MKPARRCIIAALVVGALPSFLWGAFERPWPDARSAALCSDGTWAAAVDTASAPAWLVRCDAGELFGRSELRGAAVAVARVGRASSVSFAVSELGDRPLAERSVAAGLSRTLPDGGTIGVRGRFVQLAPSGCPSRNAVVLDAALKGRIVGMLSTSVTACNVLGCRIAGSVAPQPLDLVLGFDAGDILIEAGWRLESGFDTSFHGGAELRASRLLTVRVGAATSPGILGFGVGCGRTGGAAPAVDTAWQWHPELGVSVFVSLRWSL
jgi:hypothetical protein